MKKYLWLLMLIQFEAWAGGKVSVDIPAFKDATKPSGCNVINWWGTDVLDVMRNRMEESLNQSPGVRVVEAERALVYHPTQDSNLEMIHKSTHTKNSLFSIRGTIQTFDFCNRGNPLALNAQIEIEVILLDNKTGRAVEKFVSKTSSQAAPSRDLASLKAVAIGSGVFRDSALGQAMFSALSDASSRIVKRFPNAGSMPDDYRIKLAPRSGS